MGGALLDGLLADPSVGEVHALGRRRPAVTDRRLTAHVVDFTALPKLPPLDEVYLALGTTLKIAGSEAAFRAVDFDATLAVARAALAAGARRAGLVSVIGADPHARVFYPRVKGEVEDAVAQLPFEGLVIVRPSFLTGDRAALGQAPRTGERASIVVGALLGPLLPARYRPVSAADVARTLLARVPSSKGREVLLSDALTG